MRYCIGMTMLILCVLVCCGVAAPERPVADTIWAAWVPRELTTDKANIPELLVYIQSVLRTKHDPSIKIYVDLDVISTARFSKRHNEMPDCQQNTNAPSLTGLDTPPFLDLRSALNLFCNVLGATWRQDGNALFIKKNQQYQQLSDVSLGVIQKQSTVSVGADLFGGGITLPNGFEPQKKAFASGTQTIGVSWRCGDEKAKEGE